ncbi:Type I restriction endonuclease domain-containing protein [Desulfonema limicola]|uniref:Type I restriction endonuclease domain-containing protein n=1 Tax=Desulfonema limicola TaxID=45656 RepID=A0A975B431_9BACT|nr:restriction endonuclease subunit S [Desulfonema limicola]QTA78424.1 Type I restriction endonuclease domain-containing protein [Desulfonema limicola]
MNPIYTWIVSDDLIDRIDALFYHPKYIVNHHTILNCGHKIKNLENVIDYLSKGETPLWKGDSYIDNGIYFIRGVNLNQWFVNFSEIAMISEIVHSRMKRSQLRKNDILMTMAGTIGTVAIYVHDQPANINQAIALIRPSSVIDPTYLIAYMNSLYCQRSIERRGSGGVQKNIDFHEIRKIPIVVPLDSIQSYIGSKVRLAETCREEALFLKNQVQKEIASFYFKAPITTSQKNISTLDAKDLDNPRIDAWHYLPRFTNLKQWLKQSDFILLKKIAHISTEKWNPKNTESTTFHYVEIAGIDQTSGSIIAKEILVKDAPGRARQLIRPFDIIASTVRPNRKAIAVARKTMDGWVASTGFCILRFNSPEDAYFIAEILRHDASTEQLMRWNTGAAYPAIENNVFLKVLIPNVSIEDRKNIGGNLIKHDLLIDISKELIEEAKSDVEKLIEGKLDTEGIISGCIKAPTWEDIEFQIENDVKG